VPSPGDLSFRLAPGITALQNVARYFRVFGLFTVAGLFLARVLFTLFTPAIEIRSAAGQN